MLKICWCRYLNQDYLARSVYFRMECTAGMGLSKNFEKKKNNEIFHFQSDWSDFWKSPSVFFSL